MPADAKLSAGMAEPGANAPGLRYRDGCRLFSTLPGWVPAVQRCRRGGIPGHPDPTVRRRRPMNRKFLVLAVVAAAMASACTSAGHGAAAGRPASAAPAARLTQSHPCAGIAGFGCSMLRVPLDHSGRTPGTLDLQVAAADNVSAPRGVLVFLTGGPGQPGVPFAPRIARGRHNEP